MRELADALGVKRPTLYFYFPDLGAVFEPCSTDVRGARDSGARRMRGRAHPLDRLRARDRHDDRLPPRAAAADRRACPAVGGRRARRRERDRARARRRCVAARDVLVGELGAGIAREARCGRASRSASSTPCSRRSTACSSTTCSASRGPSGVIEELADARHRTVAHAARAETTMTNRNRCGWLACRGPRRHGRAARAARRRRRGAPARVLPRAARARARRRPARSGGVGRAAIRALAGAWQARLARERPAELAARARAFVAAAARGARGAGSRRRPSARWRRWILQNCVGAGGAGGARSVRAARRRAARRPRRRCRRARR